MVEIGYVRSSPILNEVGLTNLIKKEYKDLKEFWRFYYKFPRSELKCERCGTLYGFDNFACSNCYQVGTLYAAQMIVNEKPRSRVAVCGVSPKQRKIKKDKILMEYKISKSEIDNLTKQFSELSSKLITNTEYPINAETIKKIRRIEIKLIKDLYPDVNVFKFKDKISSLGCSNVVSISKLHKRCEDETFLDPYLVGNEPREIFHFYILSSMKQAEQQKERKSYEVNVSSNYLCALLNCSYGGIHIVLNALEKERFVKNTSGTYYKILKRGLLKNVEGGGAEIIQAILSKRREQMGLELQKSGLTLRTKKEKKYFEHIPKRYVDIFRKVDHKKYWGLNE